MSTILIQNKQTKTWKTFGNFFQTFIKIFFIFLKQLVKNTWSIFLTILAILFVGHFELCVRMQTYWIMMELGNCPCPVPCLT